MAQHGSDNEYDLFKWIFFDETIISSLREIMLNFLLDFMINNS